MTPILFNLIIALAREDFKMLRKLFFILGLFYTTSAFAQMRFLMPNDQNYYVHEDDSYRFIYTDNQRALVHELKKYNSLFKQIYQKEFNWILDEKATLILASSHNQIANGFATIIPRLHTAYYSGGAEIIDEFAVNSWLYTLLIHETSHLYQLNVKRGYSQSLKNIFGNSNLTGAAVFPPFTYTMYPNAFLPTVFMEGNSTFNEGRFGNGGRLYSGASRALLLQLAKADKITTARLFNDHIEFPYGREKYLVGGYLFLDLARHHGVDKANYFFYTHADYKFNPFNINDPFIHNFGLSYDLAIDRFKEYWRPLFEAQKSAPEKPIFNSITHSGLTKDANEIRTLITSGKALPLAQIYNLNSKSWVSSKTNLPLGKLFRSNNNKLVATSSEMVSNKKIRAGLFAENYTFKKSDLDKYYYDIKDDKKLWASAKNSFLAPDLYMTTANKTIHIGRSASTGIIGQDGASYYFKQSGKTRTLMRDQTPLFSYQGYYGFPIEAKSTEAESLATKSSRVYFIGPAARGSALYLWQDGEFQRMHESDTIIDARLIDNSSALITEITDKNYEYKIVTLASVKEAPFEYTYFTEQGPNAKLLSQDEAPADPGLVSSPAPQNLTPENLALNENAYSSFKYWQFDGIDPLFFFGIDTPAIANLNIRFSDPLQNHALNLLINSGSFGEYGAGFQYINTKNIIQWDIFNLFQKRAFVESDPTQETGYIVLDRYDDWLAAIGFDYLFFKRPQLGAKLSSHFVYQNEDPSLSLSDIDKKFTLLTQFQTEKVISAPLAYSPYKSFSLNLANEYIRTAPNWIDQRNIYGGEIALSYDLFRETYLNSSYQAAYTDSPFAIVNFDDGLDDFPYPTPTQVYRNTIYKNQNYFEVRKAFLQLKQTINISHYLTQFPISLRRAALFADYSEYYGALGKRENPETLFHEYGGGVELELLLLNKFPFRARWANYKSSYAKDASSIFILGANQTF